MNENFNCLVVGNVRMWWNLRIEEVEENGRGYREGFLRLVLSKPPCALEDHVQGTVLGRRGYLW